jgi:hypothetical protein
LTAGADKFADLGERRPGMLGQLGENLLVDAIQPVHHPSCHNRLPHYCV